MGAWSQCAWYKACQIYALTRTRVGENYVRLMCRRMVRVKSCVNGFVRQVSNMDVQPLQSRVRLMCNTRRGRLCEVDVSEDGAGKHFANRFVRLSGRCSTLMSNPFSVCVNWCVTRVGETLREVDVLGDRQVFNIDVQPLQSCVGLMCHTRWWKLMWGWCVRG